MKSTATAFILLLATTFALSQSIQTIGAGPNACNGEAILTNHLLFKSWTWLRDDTKINAVDTGSQSHLVNFTINIDTNNLPQNVCKGFSVSITASQNIATCNGTAQAKVSGGTSPFKYSWSNYFNTPNQSNLCPGAYSVNVTDKNNCMAAANIAITADTVAPLQPLSIFVNTKDASSANKCNGSASLGVTGGQPPYQFHFSTGITSAIDTGLCPNSYTVTVTDQNAKSATSVFIIDFPSQIFADTTAKSPYHDSIPVANVNAPALSNCSINYAGVDSININSYSLKGLDSLIVNWKIYQTSSQSSEVTVVYPIGQNGVYNFILQLYCSNAPVKEAVNLITIVKGIQPLYINKTTLGIANAPAALNQTAVYPVPFSDQLHFTFTTTAERRIAIYDIIGKQVYAGTQCSNNSTDLTLGHLPAGTYLVKIESANAIEIIKVLKN